MRIASYIVIVVTLIQPSAVAIEPLYDSFTVDEHGGGAITSDIAEDRYGNLYFANESGLLKFDGVNWIAMPATGQAKYISSVVIDPYDRIWIASPKSIGFYVENHSGDYVYKDQTDVLLQLNEIGSIWKLYSHNNSIYVVTSSHVLRWEGAKWKTWKFNSKQRILPNWNNQTLYIHARGTGLFELKHEDFKLIADETEMISSGIISIVGSDETSLICVTVSNGLQYLEDGFFKAHPANKVDSLILDAHMMKNGLIVLGTLNKGVLYLDPTNEFAYQIPHDSSPVYQVFEDLSGSLWAATTSSILKIADPYLTQYPDKAYDVTRHEGDLYFTNERELKKIPRENTQSDAKTLLTTSGLWDLQTIGKHLIYGGSKIFGVYSKEGKNLSITHPRHVGYLFPSWAKSDLVYSSDSPTVSRWIRKPTGWEYLDSLNSFQSRALSLVELPNSKMLISGESSPLMLTDWNHPDKIESLGSEVGLPEKFIWAHLLRSDQTIIVISNLGLYRYDNGTEHFHFDPVLGNDLGLDAYALESCPSATGSGWTLHIPTIEPSKYAIGELTIQENGTLQWETFQLPSLGLAGKVEALLHEQIDGAEILWVGGSKKLLRYDLSAMPDYPAPETRLTRIMENSTETTYYNGAGATPDQLTWSYPQKTLHIEYAVLPTPLNVETYETRLTGFESEWSTPTQSTFREFTNLPHGDYRLEVRAVDEFGRKGQSAILDFSILPPWYRTLPAYACYTLSGIAFLFLGARLYSQRLRKQKAHLKALVAQRTVELEERQRELKKANRAKQNFLASMSHEIRNPLNGIIGIVRILKDKEQAAGLSSEEMSYLDACSQHLNQLLGQTLDYSSLEAGKIRTQIASFNAQKLLTEVIQIHKESAEKKELKLSLEVQELEYNLSGDPVLLKQILINLVSNAIKNTPQGSVKIELRHTEGEDSVMTQFIVSDTGSGIPKEKQSLIFKEFERLPESIEQQIPGTGLGLTISTEMAKIMGGTLTLDKDYTNGARFVLKVEFGIDLYARSPKRKTSKNSNNLLQGKRVLIADDMDFNRFISTEVLQSMGAKIDQAENGLIALNKLEKTDYDLAILDISMPQMSGIEVVEALLKKQQLHVPQFIALSAYNTPEIEKNCLEAGFDHFIEKPLDPEKLRAILLDEVLPSKMNRQEPEELLRYLVENGSRSMDQLKTEISSVFTQQLDDLEKALLQKNNNRSKEIIHKILGLNTLQANAQIGRLLNELSHLIQANNSNENISNLIADIRVELNTWLNNP